MNDLIDFSESSPCKDISDNGNITPLVSELTILDEPCLDDGAGLLIGDRPIPVEELELSPVKEHLPADDDNATGTTLPVERPSDTADSVIKIQPPSREPSTAVDIPEVPDPLLPRNCPVPRLMPGQRSRRQLVNDIWGNCIQKQWELHKLDRSRHQGDPEQPEITESRYLIIHDPELSKGVLEGVAKELNYTDSQVRIFGNNVVQFLQIQASSPDINVQRLEMARTLTDEFIFDQTVKTRATFVEPSQCPLSGFEVFLDPETPEALGRGVRPYIRLSVADPDAQSIDRAACDEDPLYFGSFCHQLSAILKRVGRLNSGYNLKVAFGRYILTTYPRKRDTYDLEGFRKLMGQSRCQGKLVSQLGRPHEALRILNALKREDGVFQPPGVNTFLLDDMEPNFTFDVYSAQHKFTAQLVREGNEKVFSMKKFQCFPLQDEDNAELCYNTLCLGREFDWKIQLMNEVRESDESYQSLKAYLATAQISFPSIPSGSDPDSVIFPHVKLGLKSNTLIGCIQKTAINSVYSFRYGLTNYILDFVIRREWNSARDMTLRHEPSSKTYSMTLRGEHWGDYQGNRATDFSRAGRGWGAELEDLLPNDPDQNATTGTTRVEALVNMVKEIHKILVMA